MARKILTADAETDPFERGIIPRPFIWGVYDGSEYKEFFDTDEFVEHVSQIECVVYAHNGGKFDWHYILHKIPSFESIMVIAGRVARFKIGKAEFRDSFNILPTKLADYKKDEIDYNIFRVGERDKPENMQKIRDYLRSDCVYLHELVTAYIADYGFNLTLASGALKFWRKLSGIKNPKTSASFYNVFYPYYFGGRVECAGVGVINKPLKMIDINSAYPEAMTHDHPYGNGYTLNDYLPDTREKIALSFIRLRCVSRGAFPLRKPTGGIYFPRDDYAREYCVTGHEYLAAIDTGTIHDIKIISAITFAETINFSEYVRHFYDLKSNSEKGSPQYIFAKLNLNSLYGKYASDPSRYSEYTMIPAHCIAASETDGYSFCAEIGANALMSRPLPEEKHNFLNVAVAASITGAVRAKLWRAWCAVKNPLYCDTDSIICEDTGDLKLHPTELGAWDVEIEADSLALAGKKLYALRKSDDFYARQCAKGADVPRYKCASKGVRLEPEEIYRVARGERVKYETIFPTYSIKQGIHFIDRVVSRANDVPLLLNE